MRAEPANRPPCPPFPSKILLLLGLLKRVLPADMLLIGFLGKGGASTCWGNDRSTGDLASVWLNPDDILGLMLLLLMGMGEEMRSETWPCKFGSMVGKNVLALLFSSDRASQKAL